MAGRESRLDVDGLERPFHRIGVVFGGEVGEPEEREGPMVGRVARAEPSASLRCLQDCRESAGPKGVMAAAQHMGEGEIGVDRSAPSPTGAGPRRNRRRNRATTPSMAALRRRAGPGRPPAAPFASRLGQRPPGSALRPKARPRRRTWHGRRGRGPSWGPAHRLAGKRIGLGCCPWRQPPGVPARLADAVPGVHAGRVQPPRALASRRRAAPAPPLRRCSSVISSCTAKMSSDLAVVALGPEMCRRSRRRSAAR